ncbi:MAG: hypothetical protein NC311_10790 [Muribaculaceae bacterium]|nr:hypothetical protein [Muribaculaceae bacterium]MCM1511410.1 hypothetical protein [Clostridium sp.]
MTESMLNKHNNEEDKAMTYEQKTYLVLIAVAVLGVAAMIFKLILTMHIFDAINAIENACDAYCDDVKHRHKLEKQNTEKRYYDVQSGYNGYKHNDNLLTK